MSHSLFALLLSLLVVFVVRAIDVEEGVLVLTDGNFDEALAANDKILVEFYAPWCGHCKSLAPEYAKAAQQLAGEPVALAKVDATENNGLAQKYEVQGFPTLKFFNGGKASEYNGGRTAGDIVSWLKKKSGPAAMTVSSAEVLEELKEAHDAFVIGVFDDVAGAAANAFLSAASGDEDNFYAISSAAEIRSTLSVSGDAVVVLKEFDDKRNDFAISASSTATDISDFVSANVVPLVNEYSREKAKKIFGSPIKLHGLFFTDRDADHHKPTVDTITETANSFKGKVLFVNIPHSEQGIMDYFSLTEADLPIFILADMGSKGGMKKFPFTGALESAGISSFISDFQSGNLKPTLKSEEPDASDTAEDVVVLKGKSFHSHVVDNSKDVMVEFYAPWCGHCKKLAPIFDELGANFKGNDNIVIAKMDSTANEIDIAGVAVEGFPTLYFFKGNDKSSPQKYEGGRDLEALTAFIESNASNLSDEL